MRTSQYYREAASKIIYISFIVLFVYTAVMKVRDYEIFKVRLGQSPMLEGMGEWMAIIIPVALLFAAVLLLFEPTRLWGMYSALALMLVFTIYIAAVLLFFAEFLPCACNGVFDFLNWKQHLWFNLIFTVLAVLGVILLRSEKKATTDRYDLVYDTM